MAIVLQTSSLMSLKIVRRSKFEDFTVMPRNQELKLTVNTLITHYLAHETSERMKMNLLGILRHHIDVCNEASCFCKKHSTFDSSKNKMIEIDRE